MPDRDLIDWKERKMETVEQFAARVIMSRDDMWQSLLSAERARREEAEKYIEKLLSVGMCKEYMRNEGCSVCNQVVADARAFLAAAAQKGGSDG